jgi:hypothetical protein
MWMWMTRDDEFKSHHLVVLVTANVHLNARRIIPPAIDVPETELDRRPAGMTFAVAANIKPLVDQRSIFFSCALPAANSSGNAFISVSMLIGLLVPGHTIHLSNLGIRHPLPARNRVMVGVARVLVHGLDGGWSMVRIRWSMTRLLHNRMIIVINHIADALPEFSGEHS